MARSILAVVAGFLVTGILIFATTAGVVATNPGAFDARSVPTTTGMLVAMHLYVAVYALLGCWVAARLAPSHPMRHAMIVAVLGVIVNAANPSIWSTYPLWSNIVSVGSPLLLGWLAGTIRERQLASARTPSMAAA
jgi:hypothetical protein